MWDFPSRGYKPLAGQVQGYGYYDVVSETPICTNSIFSTSETVQTRQDMDKICEEQHILHRSQFLIVYTQRSVKRLNRLLWSS